MSARIYAEGCHVLIDSKKTDNGYSMGGRIAKCDNPEQAQEMARRCDAFPDLLAALKAAEVALQHSAPMMDHYPEPQSRHFTALLSVRAAIAKAEGRT